MLGCGGLKNPPPAKKCVEAHCQSGRAAFSALQHTFEVSERLPLDVDVIERQQRIAAHQDGAFGARLSNEKAIKRVAVLRW